MILGYLLTWIVGISLGMMGGGGSILMVPILVYVFKQDPVTATAYSLFVVGFTSLVGAIKKYNQSLVDIKTGFTFAVPGFIGVFLSRAFIVPGLPETIINKGGFHLNKEDFIMALFAVLMIFASFSMIRQKKEMKTQSYGTNRFFNIAFLGFFVGLITGFVGAGGGFLFIPALVLLAGLPMNKAVGTSLMIIGVNSLLGFMGDVVALPNIKWSFLISLAAIATVGIFIGSQFINYIPEKSLKRAFGYFILIMGTLILSQQIYS